MYLMKTNQRPKWDFVAYSGVSEENRTLFTEKSEMNKEARGFTRRYFLDITYPCQLLIRMSAHS